ncbi:MAG TPA: hypothetical protein VGK67_33670 [Myxococcales bacterium]|jgi:hypothetical protein
MRRAPLLALLLTLAAPGLGRAAAPAAKSDFRRYFDSAVQLYRTMDLERSLEQLRLAKQQRHGADEDVVASMYEGILRFELGDEPGSASAFRAALFLDPAAAMPVQVSPRIALMLERERTRLRQKAPVTAPQPVPVVVQAQPAPQLPAQPQPVYWTAPPSQREDPQPARPVHVYQARESIDTAAAAEPAPAVAAKKRVERRLWAIAPLAAGVLALGVGGFCLDQTSGYYSALTSGTPTRSQADTYRSLGKTYQGVGWTLAGLGAAAAVAGAVLVAIPVKPEQPIAIAPLVGPGTAGLALSGALP